MPAVLRIIPTRVQTVHRNTRKPASLLDSQFLNLSRDGVATKPQTLCGFDPATVQHVERRSNDRSLEVGKEFDPYAALSCRKLRRHELLQKSRPVARGSFRRRAGLAGAFSDASLNSSGRSSTRTSTAGAITRSHRQRFSSCRTLPGKRNASSRASASGVRRFASTPSARASVRRKCSARGAMSSGRSRNGGRRSRITFRR